MATSENFVQQLYVAYYGRPADSAGLQYWADRADAEGQGAIINAFGASQEFQDNFGDLSNANLVNNLYDQLFGREADPDGLAYYTGVLNAEEKSLAEIAVTISNAAQGSDKQTFDAKVDAAAEYTAEYGAAEDYNLEAAKAVVADADGGVYQPTLTDAIAGLESAEQAKADFLDSLDLDDNPDTDTTETDVQNELTTAQAALSSDETNGSVNDLNADLQNAQDALAEAQDDISDVAGLRKAIADYQAAQETAQTAQEAANDATAEQAGEEVAFEGKNGGIDITIGADGTASYTDADTSETVNVLVLNDDDELVVADDAQDMDGVDALLTDVSANLEAQAASTDANEAEADALTEVETIEEENGATSGDTPLLDALVTAQGQVETAQEAIETREELQADVDAAQADADQLESLNDDITDAEEAIAEQGVDLNDADSAVEADLYIYAEETGDNTVTDGDSFAMDSADDLFYIGNDFTRVDLEDGVDLTATAQGSASTQEVFFQDVSGGVELSFESEAFQGSATTAGTFEGNVITLTGVSSDELQLENGYISIA